MLLAPWRPPTSRTSFPLRSKRSGSCGASTFRVTSLRPSAALLTAILCIFRCMGGLKEYRSRARWCHEEVDPTGFMYIAGSGGSYTLMQGRPWRSGYLSTRCPGRRSCHQTLLRGWRMCRGRLPSSIRLRWPCGDRSCSTWIRPSKCERGRSACNWLCGGCRSARGNGGRKREARELGRVRDRGPINFFWRALTMCFSLSPDRGWTGYCGRV